MSLPDADPRTVLPLVRWLGTEAEIVSPERLREALRTELEAMARRLSSKRIEPWRSWWVRSLYEQECPDCESIHRADQ